MRKRNLKDRSDGYYLTRLDAISKLMPYIMKDRTDAHVYFEDRVSLEKIEPFIKEYRQKYNVKIGFMHIVIASMVRAMSQKPKLNRFVVGQKTFARKHISISFIMKKAMTEQANDAAVKSIYDPRATIHDIVRIVNEDVDYNKIDSNENSTDVLAGILAFMPGFLISASIGLIKWMDGIGILPKSILDASPFHTSMFITNLGSIGIKAVYHHIYNVGTTSMFLAFGIKEKETVKAKGKDVERKYIDIKVVADERIVDGFYYAQSFKLAMKYLQNPERLLLPPEKVMVDSDI